MTDNLSLSQALYRFKTAVFAIVQKRKIKILEILILSLLPLMYLYFTYQDFSVLPMPSDPTLYLVPSTALGTPLRFFDRLTIHIGLRLFDIFISPPYFVGMHYIATVNVLIITICIFWAYFKKGILAGLFAGILLVSSVEFLRLATYIYADQTLALFALLAFIFFYSDYKNKIFDPAVIAGIFTAFTCFSKIPGIAIIIPFAITILIERNWNKLIKLFTGFLIGSLLVLFSAILLFGWGSVEAVFSFFTHRLILHTNAEAALEYFSESYLLDRNISVNSLFVEQVYLPVFFAMIILVGAYREKMTRNLYIASLSFIGILALAAAISQAVTMRPNYLYPAIVFGSLGLALYLANIIEKGNDPLIHKLDCLFSKKAEIIYAIACIVFVFLSLKIGIMYHPAFLHPTIKTTPLIIKTIYPLVPLLIIGALMAIECWKTRIGVLLLMVLISVWTSAYSSAAAYNYVSSVRAQTDYYYTAAPVLNQVPARKYSIYVEEWINKQKGDKVLWIYSYFFNDKNIKIYDGSGTTARKFSNIAFITSEKSLTADNIKGQHILTDNPPIILRHFPEAQSIKTILWKNTKLTVMKLP